MTRILATAVVMLAVLSQGCRSIEMSPAISGTVQHIQPGFQEVPLSSPRLGQATEWLESHRSNWQRCYFTPPPGPVLVVHLTYKNGEFSSLDLMPLQQGSALLLASHPGGSRLRDQPCVKMTLSEEEAARFRAIFDTRAEPANGESGATADGQTIFIREPTQEQLTRALKMKRNALGPQE